MNNYQYPRRRRGGMWLIFIILIIGVIIYANSKGIINLSSINLGNFSLSGNQTGGTNACIQKITTCETLHGYNLTILSDAQVQNNNDANSFLVMWKDVSQSGNISDYNVASYPIAMVATKVPSSNVLHVFICKSDGNIEETTALRFC